MSVDPPYPRILSLLQTGNVIPLLGAGVNATASRTTESAVWRPETENPMAPTGRDLAQYLAALARYPEEESQNDLAKVAQYYAIVLGRPDLCKCLRDVFLRNYPITSLHRFLAEQPSPQLIVTVNYDDVLERAFRESGRPFDVVVHHTDNKELAGSIVHWRGDAATPEVVAPKRLLIDLDRTTVIYKMHGTMDRQEESRDSFVVTEDDYVDFLVRLGRQAAIPPIFAEPFRRRHFLFLGYSLRDWNFRVVLSKIERDWRRKGTEGPASWAIQRNPSVVEQEFWKRRNVSIFTQAIEDFVKVLAQEAAAV